MGKTTTEFIKLRSSGEPKTGEWNINYEQALEKSKNEHKFIVTSWSNGDGCSYCVAAEKCMMTDIFKDWMKTTDAYFVFQYSGDKDEGKVVHDWIYNKTTKLKKYPGFRVTLYDAAGGIICDKAIEGNDLRGNKSGEAGAKNMIANLEKIFSSAKTMNLAEADDVGQDYKIRLNEKLTVKKVNAILDAIDKNDGYCPCQPRDEDTKCHCKDFIEDKGFGEPCICNIYVKMKKTSGKPDDAGKPKKAVSKKSKGKSRKA